jgi:hypothetical protein
MGCRSNENEINNAATELANIIISAVNKFLKRRNFTKNKKKNKNKKYFDTDLQILRKNLTDLPQVVDKCYYITWYQGTCRHGGI